jgi:hypothetical protein
MTENGCKFCEASCLLANVRAIPPGIRIAFTLLSNEGLVQTNLRRKISGITSQLRRMQKFRNILDSLGGDFEEPE